MCRSLAPSPQLNMAEELYQRGRVWLSASEAAPLLQCEPESLTSAAESRGSLGTLDFIWAGRFLKISTMSVIRFLGGGSA